jgi:hypothetical protein
MKDVCLGIGIGFYLAGIPFAAFLLSLGGFYTAGRGFAKCLLPGTVWPIMLVFAIFDEVREWCK